MEELAASLGGPRALAVRAAREAIEEERRRLSEGEPPGEVTADARGRMAALTRPSLRRVLNASGVIVHTNLGRAPLPEAAVAAALEAAAGYSNLEFDLGSGERGSRQAHVEDLVRELTGAEAALVVNNCAAAVLLAAAALAGGRELVVSRGQLVEIGGVVPHSRRGGPVGRAAARGGHHQPHPPRRLRARTRAGHRRDPARPPVELPHRGLRGGAGDRGAVLARGAR